MVRVAVYLFAGYMVLLFIGLAVSLPLPTEPTEVLVLEAPKPIPPPMVVKKLLPIGKEEAPPWEGAKRCGKYFWWDEKDSSFRFTFQDEKDGEPANFVVVLTPTVEGLLRRTVPHLSVPTLRTVQMPGETWARDEISISSEDLAASPCLQKVKDRAKWPRGLQFAKVIHSPGSNPWAFTF